MSTAYVTRANVVVSFEKYRFLRALKLIEGGGIEAQFQAGLLELKQEGDDVRYNDIRENKA